MRINLATESLNVSECPSSIFAPRTAAISRCGDEMMRMMLYEAAQVILARSAKWSWFKAGRCRSLGAGG